MAKRKTKASKNLGKSVRDAKHALENAAERRRRGLTSGTGFTRAEREAELRAQAIGASRIVRGSSKAQSKKRKSRRK
jgi:hypothetical protein